MPSIWDLTNPAKPTAIVDNNSIDDYSQTWADWLADCSDTIASIDILPQIPDSGLAPDVVTQSHAAGVVTAFLDFNPCTVGIRQIVTYRVITTGGRQEDRSFYFKVKQR